MTALSTFRGRSRKVQILLLSAMILIILVSWVAFRRLMGQLALGALLSALALPIARKMEGRIGKSGAAALAVGALAVGLLGLIGLITPPLISQISQLISQAPALFLSAQQMIQSVTKQEWARYLGVNDNLLKQWLLSAAEWAAAALPQIIQGIGAGVEGVSRAILAPVLAYYFVKDRETFTYRLSLWIPLRLRKRFLTALQEMRREAGGYVRGQLLVAGAVGALTALGLMLAGIPSWLILGIVMGLSEFIPYIGPMIGGLPIALLSLPLGLGKALWALGITIFIQQVEGSFLSPRLMAMNTGLHPVSVLILLSVGGAMGGLIGMVAAVPLFVCARGAVRVLYETRRQ